MTDSKRWSDTELSIALETYIYLLRIELAGISLPEREISEIFTRRALPDRNATSIRYRLRNISAVFRSRGLPTLSRFSPAERVGSGVKKRIERMLEGRHYALNDLLTGNRTSTTQPRNLSLEAYKGDAIARLTALQAALDDVIRLPQIGHNRPPEPIQEVAFPTEELERARTLARDLSSEVRKDKPQAEVLASLQQKLLEFGVAVASWLGARVTKFADAALMTLAPIAIVKFTNMLPLVGDAVAALSRVIQHLF